MIMSVDIDVGIKANIEWMFVKKPRNNFYFFMKKNEKNSHNSFSFLIDFLNWL